MVVINIYEVVFLGYLDVAVYFMIMKSFSLYTIFSLFLCIFHELQNEGPPVNSSLEHRNQDHVSKSEFQPLCLEQYLRAVGTPASLP